MCEHTMPKNVKPSIMKTCSRCDATDVAERFIKNRNICLKCESEARKTARKNAVIDANTLKTCNTCETELSATLFLYNGLKCVECRNTARKEKYASDETHRKKAIASASEFKHKKVEVKRKQKEDDLKVLEERIGSENTICKYCGIVKNKDRFRYNRLKCRECERDDPAARIIRNTRSRVLSCLETKTESLVSYLGCSGKMYYDWLLYSNPEFILKTGWHIDHVIPVSHFNIESTDDHMIMFNWRNTMPLIAYENLSKNNKILPEQIKAHIEKLEQFHEENNIEFPNEFRALFAKHLVAGSPLEPMLSNK
jgi:hypothetical protein